jgi:nucleotide-binding universal stress UspA family protein
MSRIRNVLHASDFSRESSRAFAMAVKMAKSNRARLTIASVIVPIVPLVPEQTLEIATWRDIEAQTRKWAEQQLKRLTDKARAAGVTVSTRLHTGDPAREIVRAAKAAKADMIVIGTHGRTGFSKLMLGSVAQRVVATAPCPVLTVRSPHK